MVFSILQHHRISDQYRKCACAAAHISAEIKVTDQLVSARCTASRFVDDSAPSGDCGAGPARHREVNRDPRIGVVLGHGDCHRIAACGIACAANLIGDVIAAVVCFVGGIGAGYQQHFKRVGVKVDCTGNRVVVETGVG